MARPGGSGSAAVMRMDVSALGTWLLDGHDSPAVAWLLKRTADVLLAAVLLILCAPILAVAALLVRLSGPGPVLFRQTRVGYRAEPFTIYKLRTMVHGAPDLHALTLGRDPGRLFFKMGDDPRITPVGRLLRITSIDELPQLLNVLRGDMSLVGPRPLSAVEADKLVWARHRRRFAVLPGITGLWQVSGRSLCSDQERLQLDARYVEEWSLALDLEILMRTIPTVVTARGAA